MSWIQATFVNRSGKRQQVWVETDDDGEFVVADGRVPMRYQNEDDAKVYSAHPRNLSMDPSDLEPTNGRRGRRSKEPTNKKTADFDDLVWQTPDGQMVVGTVVPPELVDEPLPEPGVIDVWTDGACTGNPGPSGYGVVVREGERYREYSQFIGMGTNNIAELLAIRVALQQTEGSTDPIVIHTDSNYSIGVLTKGWKAKANVELIADIKALIADRSAKPKFVKVKGHAGIPLNERADDLAVAAVERRS
jgi:ribonuclease HI